MSFVGAAVIDSIRIFARFSSKQRISIFDEPELRLFYARDRSYF